MKNKSLALALALLMLLLLVPSGVFAVDLPNTYNEHLELLIKSDVDLSDPSNFEDNDDYLAFYSSGTYEISMQQGKKYADCVFYVSGSNVTLILNNVGLNIDKGEEPTGIFANGIGSLNIELVGKNVFQVLNPMTASYCCGIDTDGDFPVHIYGAGSLEISGCGEDDYPIEVSGDLTLGKAGSSRTSLTVNGMGTNGRDSIYSDGTFAIENADLTVNDSDDDAIDADGVNINNSTVIISDSFDSGIEVDSGGNFYVNNSELTLKNIGDEGIYTSEDILIEDSTINISSVKNDGLDASGSIFVDNSELTITGTGSSGIESDGGVFITDSTLKISASDAHGIYSISSDIEFHGERTVIDIANCGQMAVFARYGGTISLEDPLAILSPDNGEIVSFSYESNGSSYNAQTIALPDAVIEYDENDGLFTGASQSVKIAAPEPEQSFLEQLLGFFKKLAALINYLNTGIVVLPSEF